MSTPKITILDRKTPGKPKRLQVESLNKKKGWLYWLKSFFIRR